MKILELFNIAISSITSNKMRSILTMLGLIIGISSVVTIISIGEGSQSSIESNLDALGLNTVNISYERNVEVSPSESFSSKDIEGITEEFSEEVLAAIPSYSGNGTVVGDIDTTDITITGSNEHVVIIDDLELLSGRGLATVDLKERRNVIMIDDTVAKDLFGSSQVAGETIMIKIGKNTQRFVVVGVYKAEESGLGFSTSKGYIPYTSADKLLNKNGSFSSMSVTLQEGVDVDTVSQDIVDYLHRRHRVTDQAKYRYFSMASQIAMVTDIMSQITLLISAIAGISLVVGGIGVMNIMLVSVTERTREIGIRKALGAKRPDILIQFLIEAVTICLIGGFIGVGFGMIFTKIAENLMATPMTISATSILLATTFSTLIGVVFGVYPANKASKLDPIEALRYE